MRELGSGKPVRRAFPGPRGARSPLRVAIERAAHADLIAHAKESLDAEICGVLAGSVCEDDEGLFVHVQAVIRGAAATQGSTHVTFTQATWNAIHTALERDHPKLKIVGWYHSHPGFGVEFSEMDLFIQRNFFSGPAQVALVTDPLSGAVALCVNTAQGIEYLPALWVDGREHTCPVPAKAKGSATVNPAAAEPAGDAATARKLQELEARVGQLVLAVDDLRGATHRFLLFAGVVVAVGVLAVAGYGVYLQMMTRVEPPRNIGFMPVPVQIEGKTAILGVSVVKWDLPPEMDVMRAAVEQLRRELEQAAKAVGTNAPSLTNLPPVAAPGTSQPPSKP